MDVLISDQAQDLLLKIAKCDIFSTFAGGEQCAHPCSEILNCQTNFAKGSRQTPVPWVGEIENTPILFISSNPALKEEEYVALESWSDISVIDVHQNAFNQNREWTKQGNKIRKLPLIPENYIAVPFWTYIWKTTGEILGIDFGDVLPGKHAAISEIVHCKSNNQIGVNNAKKTCMDKYLEPLLKLSSASIIVLLGAHSSKIISDRYGLDITLATETRMTKTHLIEKHIAGRKRLIVAIPHNNYHGKKGLTWLQIEEKEMLLKWGKNPN
jgi:uracil-DNA glycosylase